MIGGPRCKRAGCTDGWKGMATVTRVESSRKKRARIIQTTTRLLLKKGSSVSTSTTEICSAARLTRPTLYHYFGSKRNLMLCVHMDHMEKTLKPYLEKATAIMDPLDRLSYMIRTFTTEIICKHPELRVLIHDSLTMKDKYFQEVRSIWKEHYTLLSDTISQLQSEGVAAPGLRPSWAALFVLGMVTWVLYWFDYDRKGNVDELGNQALQHVLHGLGLGSRDGGRP